MHRALLALGILPALLGLAASAVAQDRGPEDVLVVGSKNFTENRLLAETMAQLIEAQTGLTVERRTNLAGTLIAHTALTSGEIDLYPEYTGTGWSVVLGHGETSTDPLRTYLEVAHEYEERFGVRWLRPFGFSNSYAVAVLESTAQRLGIERVSDLRTHQQDLKVAWSTEFLNREDGYPGLRQAYDLDLADVRGLEHGLAYEAIRTGTVDVTDAYTTDGKLLQFPVRVLEDDRRFFPPYDCAPVVRLDTLKEHPELAEVLDRLAFSLPAERMQRLNYQVEEEGRSFAEVATSFLREQSLLEDPAEAVEPEATRADGFFAYFWRRVPETLELTLEHLVLTGIAVGLAILFAVPLGVLLTRRRRLAPGFLGAAGVIQTIPSLALLAFMIPIPLLGLGARSAIAALFLYAILPILRNTYAGIQEVDRDTVEAALGMGLTDGQVLRLVELPLAARTIMAGIRTGAVISIGVATLAAFIGAGGLGEPIVTGLQLNDTRLILSGAIPAALLALLADWLMGRVEIVVTPGADQGA